jgi:pyruvate dehydrogenase E1 component
MLVDQSDVFYYITLMNENYPQPDVPPESYEGIIRGGYRFGLYGDGTPQVTLLGSGAILNEVVAAAKELADSGMPSEVMSITSWSELARDGQSCEQQRLRGEQAPIPWLSSLLGRTTTPIVAATDYVRAVPESIRAYLPHDRRYTTLGTDGFGRSDTRAALRSFFGVDSEHIAAAARAAVRDSAGIAQPVASSVAAEDREQRLNRPAQ